MPKKELKEHKFDNQHDDEELLMMFRQHPIVMRKGLIITLAMLVVGLIPVVIWPLRLGYLWFAPLGMALGGVWLFWEWIGWYYSVIYVSDQRIIYIKQKGLFSRSVVDVGLDKIQNINFEIPGMQATMFKFGTIVVQTFAGDLVMDKIYHPQMIQESLIKIIKELGYGSSFADTALKASHSEDTDDQES